MESGRRRSSQACLSVRGCTPSFLSLSLLQPSHLRFYRALYRPSIPRKPIATKVARSPILSADFLELRGGPSASRVPPLFLRLFGRKAAGEETTRGREAVVDCTEIERPRSRSARTMTQKIETGRGEADSRNGQTFLRFPRREERRGTRNPVNSSRPIGKSTLRTRGSAG